MFAGTFDAREILRNAAPFHRVSEDGLDELTEMGQAVTLRQGQAVCRQGARADCFFVVVDGTVELSRRGRGGEYAEGILATGDCLGSEALAGRTWEMSATALTSTVLLRFEAASLARWAAQNPEVKISLQLDRATRQLAREARVTFLQADESVYFITRKHPVFLLQKLIAPLILAGLCVFGFAYLYFSPFGETPLAFAAAGTLLGCSGLWFVWNLLDWTNDYSIVTSQRLVWLERIAGIYDSRQEAPLSTVQSVDVRSSQLGRFIGYGDVIIRTYSGTVVFQRVGRPRQVAALVEDHWFRAKVSSRRIEAAAMERAIRERLGLAEEQTGQDDVFGDDSPVQPLIKPGKIPTLFSTLLHMRFEAGGIITYRKHWFVLIQQTWKPLFWLGVAAAIGAARVFDVFTLFSVAAILLVCGLAGLGVFFWLIYEYLDWRNDIFQVTAEQVVDLDRKPFGREEKKSAPLENILSIQYQRLGLLGLIFNFGTVYITVGNTTLTFDTIFNPSQVQQDIFNRMAERAAWKKRQDQVEQRERVTDWFASYAEIQKETGTQPAEDEWQEYPDSDLF